MQRKDIKFSAILLVFLLMMSLEVPKDWRVVASAILGLYAACMIWRASETPVGKFIAAIAPVALFMFARFFSAEMSGILRRNPVEKVGKLLGYYAYESADQIMVIIHWSKRSAELKAGYAIAGAFCAILILCLAFKLLFTKSPKPQPH